MSYIQPTLKRARVLKNGEVDSDTMYPGHAEMASYLLNTLKPGYEFSVEYFDIPNPNYEKPLPPPPPEPKRPLTEEEIKLRKQFGLK